MKVSLSRKSLLTVPSLLLVLGLLVAACSPTATVIPTSVATQSPTATSQPPPEPTQAEPAATPSVTVADQEIKDGTITIAEVVSPAAGWIVIHTEKDGKPGPVIGYAALSTGVNTNVVVQIDSAQATETLFAMLHKDEGYVGTYEFPGADAPVMVNGQMVTPSFKATQAMAAAPSVMVKDQAFNEDTVTVESVFSVGPGWIVIHIDNNGKPGAVLGYAPVKDGLNTNVVVAIDESDATPVLYAMLHTDAGIVGTYEFPGADAPMMVNGQMLSPAFRVDGAASSAPAVPSATVMVSENATLGKFLVDSKGLTLYLFTKDSPNKTTCFDNCLVNWPPLLVSGTPTAGAGVDDSRLGTIVRPDGATQVTYNGMPLYYFIGDSQPGQTNGQNVGSVWFVVAP